MSAVPLFVSLEESGDVSRSLVGDKASALASLARGGVPICDGGVITTEAYRRFVTANGLKEIAAAEIARRTRVPSRAEEYWDSAQRIRVVFLRASWPNGLDEEILAAVGPLADEELVVRASAAHSGTSARGFTRMYDSLTDVSDGEQFLKALKWVWGSLFSDRALLYASELGLDAHTSEMAVILQPQFAPTAAGRVLTSLSTEEPLLVEAVSGAASQLVDGLVVPHRWAVDRRTGNVLEYGPPEDDGTSPSHTAPPLSDMQVQMAVRHSLTAESHFGAAQATEFAVMGGRLMLIDSRANAEVPRDGRAAYLEVRLPESRLEKRAHRIETEYLPAMWSEANALSVVDLTCLTDAELLSEAARRAEALAHWRMVYRTVLAPFAHGQRLFGEYYAYLFAPADPFEFITLLVRTPNEYLQRQQVMAELGVEPPPPPHTQQVRDAAEQAFFAAVPQGERVHAEWLLQLARASWRMRDDDNLYLDRIRSEARRAYDEIRRRLEGVPGESRSVSGPASREQLLASARMLGTLFVVKPEPASGARGGQTVGPGERLEGDPAAPGSVRGPARVAATLRDAQKLLPGEVLVIDELPPDAAAVATRAAAIVESRGGMFAHGAVVAREFGIPCVTAIPDVIHLFRDGDIIEVDGGTGTVTIAVS